MPLEPGNLLNQRYRILEVLGHGGMGSVYHAIDEVLEIEVAVKENLFTSQEYAEQFQREARILASLRHPNLPRVTDYFVLEGQGQYLIMDYIPGEDLRERIERRGPLPIHEVVTIGVAVCEALEYLHSQNPPVVHRDLKPGNVRITPEGRVYLVDFGLAKIGGRDQHTVTGAQAVTPGFSPPEQYGTNAHTEPRSDIYSLAATLYMALTGKPPADAFERLMGNAELEPITELRPEVPPQLAQALETALALRPEDRFADARAFKEALLALGLIPDQEARLEEHRWVVSPSGGPLAWRTQQDAQFPQDTIVPPQAKQQPPAAQSARHTPRRRGGCLLRTLLLLLLIVGGLGAWFRFTPNAWQTLPTTLQERLAWARTWLALISTPSPGPLLPSPTTSPIPTRSATPTASSTPTPQPSVTSSPQPSSTPSTTPNTVGGILPTETLSPTLMPSPVATPWGGGAGQLAFASDRSGLVQIWLYDLQSGSLQQLTNEPDGACQPAWSPDGYRLAYITPCTENAPRYENARILVLDLRTGVVDTLVPPSRSDYDPAWSPDGRYLAFTSLRDGQPDIYLLDLTTEEVRNLSNDPADDFNPSWAPDGKRLAFISTRQGTYRVYLLDLETETQEGFSRSKSNKNFHPVWSPDGVNLLYQQIPANGGLPILVYAPIQENGLIERPLTLTGVPMADPNYSPDGRWIAFTGWPEKNYDIYIISANGQTWQRLTTEPSQEFDPAWRPPLP